jgi:hypothetical protein
MAVPFRAGGGRFSLSSFSLFEDVSFDGDYNPLGLAPGFGGLFAIEKDRNCAEENSFWLRFFDARLCSS